MTNCAHLLLAVSDADASDASSQDMYVTSSSYALSGERSRRTTVAGQAQSTRALDQV